MRSMLFLAPLALLTIVPAQAQSKIVFDSNRDGNNEIYSMAPDGSGQTNLTKTSSVDESVPGISPDGSQIDYQRTDDIWVMKSDGSNQHGLNIGHIPMQAGFRPGTNLISYSRFGGYDHDIYTINPDGTGELRIVNNPLGDYYPRWSPDGNRLSFVTFNNDNYLPNIYLANPDGSGQIKLTTTDHDVNASWSPDGGQLVFESDRDGNKEIYLMNADGTGVTRLTNNPAADLNPCFSPDGTRIAFSSDRDGDSEIYVMNVDGTGVTQLTFNSASDANPAWVAAIPANAPTVSIGDATVTEGSSGTATNKAKFTISLSAASTQTIKVGYRTYNGTATRQDYTAIPTSVVTFAPGETSKQIAVPIMGDTLDEGNETFQVRIAVAGAKLGDQIGIGTIIDDDASPTIDISSVSKAEGNSGATTFSFPVKLSTISGQDVSVHYSTSDGTAQAGSDYTAANGILTIPAGQTTGTINVSVLGDTALESSEYFNLNLDSPVNASSILHSQVRGTITNDDLYPGLSVSDASTAEGGALTFTITLSQAFTSPVTVSYSTADGTAKSGGDYVAASGSVTIPAGQTTKTITVATVNDNIPEPTETFTLNLSNPVNALLDDAQGVGTITNEDFPKIFISSVTMMEGDSGQRAMYFTVSLSAAAPYAVTTNYATAAGTATAGTDFVSTSGSLTIAAGQTSQIIAVPINGDETYESNETFYVDLSNVSGATVAQSRGTGTIVNDDSAPAAKIENQEFPAGPSGKAS